MENLIYSAIGFSALYILYLLCYKYFNINKEFKFTSWALVGLLVFSLIFAFQNQRYLPTKSSVSNQSNPALQEQLREVDQHHHLGELKTPSTGTLEKSLNDSWELKKKENDEENNSAKEKFLNL